MTKTIDTTDLSPFIVPPQCAGQTIETAYASDYEGGVVRRTTDRSDGSIEYHRGELQGSYEPQNAVPQVTEWRSVRVR